ncbi:MAG: branched-chain amino acid ABC transporter permease [Armatimonadota bacterium]|nr:branched-chain amino acid ABC transporter permease [Armatimonadota bacterium]MDR5702270.1 branched-chain amino acid ABC transporter permease [Armatimonadota bacterium]
MRADWRVFNARDIGMVLRISFGAWRRQWLDLALTFGMLILAAILPLGIPSIYWQGVLTVTLVYALASTGWNILGGFTGQFSLAPATFLMLGMYTSALLVHYRGWPPVAGILATLPVTSVIGMVLGLLCLRLRGPYLALTTVAFSEITRNLIRFSYNFTRGDLGLSVPTLYGMEGNRLYYYYTIYLLNIAVILAVHLLMSSRVGLYLRSIRDDEVAAAGRGVNTVLWKTMAFTISSSICGLAGGYYVHFIGLASPEMGLLLQAGFIISMAVIGGMGTLGGPLAGAMLLYPLSEYVRRFGIQHMVIFSFLMILMIRFWKAGIYGTILNIMDRWVTSSGSAPALGSKYL